MTSTGVLKKRCAKVSGTSERGRLLRGRFRVECETFLLREKILFCPVGERAKWIRVYGRWLPRHINGRLHALFANLRCMWATVSFFLTENKSAVPPHSCGPLCRMACVQRFPLSQQDVNITCSPGCIVDERKEPFIRYRRSGASNAHVCIWRLSFLCGRRLQLLSCPPLSRHGGETRSQRRSCSSGPLLRWGSCFTVIFRICFSPSTTQHFDVCIERRLTTLSKRRREWCGSVATQKLNYICMKPHCKLEIL